jgi:ribonuclease D
MSAIDHGLALDESELPERAARVAGPPQPRAWADRDEVAARRLDFARAGITKMAEANNLPPENLLQPDAMRRLLWEPPTTRDPGDLLDDVVARLQWSGARPWQIAMTASLLTDAILSAEA